tara:strand:+ start:485 stop:1378 length:894 start_codon:yes stop_codon:yes gene_type:complete
MSAFEFLKSNRTPYFLMFFTVLFWGLSWPVGSIVAKEFGPNVFTAAFIRFSIAIPFLLIFALFIDKGIKIPKSYLPKIAVLGLLQITIYNFMYLSGLRFTSSSDASIIIAANPSLTAIFSSLLYSDEKLSIKRLIGIITAFLGVVTIFVDSPNTDVENRLLGNILIFSGALVWALYTSFSRPVYDKISPLRFQVWATIFGWLMLGVISLFEKPWTLEYTQEGISGLFYLGLFAAAISNTFFSYSVKKIGPTKTAIFVNTVPLIGVLSSIIILGDSFSLVYVFAFLLIVFGVNVVNNS